MAKEYQFELLFKVRDYECDLQGVVNNSVYQNYLEHTRHEFLLSLGVDFAELFKQGIMAVVARIDLSYKTALKSGDQFACRVNVVREGIKFIFYQDIYRLADEKICLKGIVTTVMVVNGRLSMPDEVLKCIEPVMSQPIV